MKYAHTLLYWSQLANFVAALAYNILDKGVVPKYSELRNGESMKANKYIHLFLLFTSLRLNVTFRT